MFSVEHIGLAEGSLQYAKVVGPTYDGLTLEEIESVGLNCQLFAHWVLEELCLLSLPKEYLSSHIWADTRFLRGIDFATERPQIGDILFFYKDPVAKQMDLHIAVVVDKNEVGQAQLLHCIKRKDPADPSVVVWTLQDFAQSKMNGHFYGGRRVVTQKSLAEFDLEDFDDPTRQVCAIPFPEQNA